MEKVLVAMSGGVDSSLAAALLKDQGYEVIGVTMRLWYNEEDENIALQNNRGCCSLTSVNDARRVAAILDIPYYVLNFEEAFRKKVVDRFIAEYSKGRTPNPCIACNRYLKFDLLLQKAISLGAKYVATGHYAKIEHDKSTGRYLLKKSKDAKKDQTYNLFNMTQDQLRHTLFPLGGMVKENTRELAKKYNLPVYDKPDSQEICFIPDNDYKKFLTEKEKITFKEGPMINTKGEKIAQHKGIAFYTIGQRKGLGIATGTPLYVVDIDVENNTVVVGTKEELGNKGLIAYDLNFFPYDKLEGEMKANVKIRYKSPEVPATVTIEKEAGRVKVYFEKQVDAVTPGQAVVFYQDDLVVGGGTIEKAINT